MIHSCPPDIVNLISGLLCPKDISNLASCNKWLSEILPVQPLRVQIQTSDSKHILDHALFVSDEGGRMLRHEEHLKLGQRYRLWLYDAIRQNRMDMVRQIPIGDGFDITLQPQQRKPCDFCPLQLWSISHAENKSKDSVVQWGTEIGLSVGGDQDEPRRASSIESTLLSFSPKLTTSDGDSSSGYPVTGVQWHSTTSVWGKNERMILLRKEIDRFQDERIVDDTNEKPPTPAIKITLEFRAPRVLHDDRGLLGYYSRRSLKAGTIDLERYHAKVRFELWTENGYMIVKSESLDYALAIPIILNENYDEIPNEPEVLDLYYNIKYFYAWAGKFYMAASADAQSSPDSYTSLQSFGERSKVDGSCDDVEKRFVIRYDEREETSQLDKTFKFPRDPSCFFYCVLASRTNC
mmetsp:Transcript_26724/g.39525  ORF Transcript_26724/g.39525 Transcript_26724/m.39525 type:complete len:407 (+) Transcript_26724:106-1326(+)